MKKIEVGMMVRLVVRVHGFDIVTEDYDGKVVQLGRRGDERFVKLQLKSGCCNFYECDIKKVVVL